MVCIFVVIFSSLVRGDNLLYDWTTTRSISVLDSCSHAHRYIFGCSVFGAANWSCLSCAGEWVKVFTGTWHEIQKMWRLSFDFLIMAVGADVVKYYFYMFWFQNAVFIGPITTIPIFLFAGFFVTLKAVPAYLRWVSWLSYARYSFQSTLTAGEYQSLIVPVLIEFTLHTLPCCLALLCFT